MLGTLVRKDRGSAYQIAQVPCGTALTSCRGILYTYLSVVALDDKDSLDSECCKDNRLNAFIHLLAK